MIARQIVNGLMLGGIYVLVAVSFTLAMDVLTFLSFSIPGLSMLGGMASWFLLRQGWHWSLAIGGALASGGLHRTWLEPNSSRAVPSCSLG